MLEATYLFNFNDALSVQPDLQYIFNPGGVGDAERFGGGASLQYHLLRGSGAMIFVLRFLERSRRQIVALIVAIVLVVAMAMPPAATSFPFRSSICRRLPCPFGLSGRVCAGDRVSSGLRTAGDLLAGAREKLLLAAWNAALALGFYLVTIRILSALRAPGEPGK